jgi:hypothetical protein
MSSQRYLTKSRFKLALECPRKLFYCSKKEYANLNDDNDFLHSLAEGGYQVGELAKHYFPGGHDIKSLDHDEALAETDELLKSDKVVIYEAALRYRNCFIRVDILRKDGSDIDLVEVKAKSFMPEEDTFTNKSGFVDTGWSPYLYDVAFQTWVAGNAFPSWNVKPFLMLADKSKPAAVDGLNQIFKITRDSDGRIAIRTDDCKLTQELLDNRVLVQVPVEPLLEMIYKGADKHQDKKGEEERKAFEFRINEYADYYERDQPYPAGIGAKCKQCEFNCNEDARSKGLKSGFEECWKTACGDGFDFREPLIFELWNCRKNSKFIEDGVYHLKDIEPESLTGATGDRQRLQITKTCIEKDGKDIIMPGLHEKMNAWRFPLHFIDFETSMVALPFNKGRHPYEQIAFQFSCHTLHGDGKVVHNEFIHCEPGTFPNYEFVKSLKSVLDKDDGTIFRYAAHENTVLRQIQRQMESDVAAKRAYKSLLDLSGWIDTVTEYKIGRDRFYGARNMVDLKDMVQKYYYHPAMRGSNSLKAVLPAIMNSDFIREKYGKPLWFGTNLKDMVLWQHDASKQQACDPYKLLPPVFEDIELNEGERVYDSDELNEGGAAMTAYCRMQFSEMSGAEREAIISALLKYCELDTLAMLLIYEYWKHSPSPV